MVRHILIILLLLVPVNAFAGKYDDALDHAKRALYKQSGLEFRVEQIKDYGTREYKRFAQEQGITKEVGIVGFIIKSAYNKQIVLKYKKLGVEVSEAKTQLTLTWRF